MWRTRGDQGGDELRQLRDCAVSHRDWTHPAALGCVADVGMAVVDVVGIETDIPVLRPTYAGQEIHVSARWNESSLGALGRSGSHLCDRKARDVKLLMKLRAVRAVEDERAIVVPNPNVELPVTWLKHERESRRFSRQRHK